jgi:hypothetical protein
MVPVITSDRPPIWGVSKGADLRGFLQADRGGRSNPQVWRLTTAAGPG